MNHRFLLKLSGFALMACYAASILAGAGARPNVPPSPAPDTPAVKVGVLHSLTGTMAISEVTVKNATMLAIDQLNASGGALGKQVEPVIEDGASDPAIFSQKAQKLIQQDKVATVFGGWTSASRKAMLPVFERFHSLLWYPVQYEGLESSPYIYYTGATPTSRSFRAWTISSRRARR